MLPILRKGCVSLQLHSNSSIQSQAVEVGTSLPAAKRQVPGYASDDPYLSISVKDHPSEVTLLLGLIEKALVKHICDGDYAKLSKLSILDVLRALLGPQVAMEFISHDTTANVWNEVRRGLEAN